MKAIIGTVTAIDDRRKTFALSAPSRRAGRETAREFNILSSRRTAFVRKGKTRASSSLEKMRIGMAVIVQLQDGVALSAARLPAIEVWHPPIRASNGTKGIPLTRRECADLGGKLEDDANCPETRPASGGPLAAGRVRCRTAAGSACVNESDKA